jgi:lysozyme family protein
MDVIDEIIEREGPETNDPVDKGGRTAFGISEATNPEAWADDTVSREEARAIYEEKYIRKPGFHHIHDLKLRAQLIDFGVNSGPKLAIIKLQEILKGDPDGIIGPDTLTRLSVAETVVDINVLLVISRVKMIGRIVTKDPTQLKFLNGWLNRALSFLA